MQTDRKAQQQMHKHFFDRCKEAIDHNFYMEAILMEYAAIEARLEILLGLFGMPCDQNLADELRCKINISHRLKCAKTLLKRSPAFEQTKLSPTYFKDLDNWIKNRNGYVHGLYKNVLKYSTRITDAEHFAQQGQDYCRSLYNEVDRLKRVKKKHPEYFRNVSTCCSSGCKLYPKPDRPSSEQ